MLCNRKKLAEILGHDVKTIDRMVQEGMPYVSRPAGDQRSWVFDTAAILRWMTGGGSSERDNAARSRLLEAKAGLKWLEYGQALGFLVGVDDVMPPFEEILQVTKSRIFAMPGRLDQLLAAESDPAAVERIIQDEIDDIFAQMDRMAQALADELMPPS